MLRKVYAETLARLKKTDPERAKKFEEFGEMCKRIGLPLPILHEDLPKEIQMNNAEQWGIFAEHRLKQGNYQEAYDYAKQALSVNPRQPEALKVMRQLKMIMKNAIKLPRKPESK